MNCYVNYVIITELVHRAKGCGCSVEIESGDKERADKERADNEIDKEIAERKSSVDCGWRGRIQRVWRRNR